jgi:glycine oxidase
MSASLDAIVVGGGVIGLAVAWALASEGLEVIVLERGRAGRESSWAAGGMLCPVSEAHFTETELLELTLESMRRYPDFVARLEETSGRSVDYLDVGTLVVALDRDEARNYQRLLRFQQSLGLPAEWLTGDECRELEPMLSPRVVGGIRAAQDHQIDNRKLVEALHRAATRCGVTIREHTPALRVVIDGGRVRGVRTRRGLLQAKWVVLAAGAWSAQLGGLPASAVPPVRPVKGELIVGQMDPTQPLTRHTIRGRRAYLVPRRDGRLLVGASSEERGFDREPTIGATYELLRGVYGLLPGSYELPMKEMVVGFRPASADNLPVLGPGPAEGLIYATGHYRHGILLTPVTAWAISRTILDGALPEAIEPFRAERFWEGARSNGAES